MIKSKEISVVVQGAIDKEKTPECLKSIRKYLPDAQIILSTWEGSDTQGLDYDKLILNKDPGASDLIRKYPFEHVNNVNRQIVSSKNGIGQAERQYILKLRADMILEGAGLLDYYNSLGKFVNSKSVFKERIALNASTTHDNGLFAFADWWSFGLKEDMLKLWDIPLYPDKKGGEFFLKKENTAKIPFGSDQAGRFYPECWIAYQCYLKFYDDLTLEHCFDFSNNSIEKSNLFLMNNFLTVENCFSNIYLHKADNMQTVTNRKNYYNHKKQLRHLYNNFGKNILTPAQKIKYNAVYYLDNPYKPELKELFYIFIIKNYAKLNNLTQINYEPIQDKDITFVVTGLIEKKTKKNLKQIKKLYPECTIILSVSSDTDVSGLEGLYDRLVKTKIQENYYLENDFYLFSNRKFTYNKQQQEIFNALKEVKTKYSVRFRTDLYLKNRNLTDKYQKYSALFNNTQQDKMMFKQRVLVPQYITGGKLANCFFVSEILGFGLTEDIKKMYSGTLMTKDDIEFFAQKENKKFDNPEKYATKYTTEQFFWLNTIKNCGFEFDTPNTYCDYTTEQALRHEQLLANNLIVLSFEKLGIKSKFNEYEINRGLNFSNFIELYLLNVNPSDKKIQKLFLKMKYYEKFLKNKLKLQKHIKNFLIPFKSLFKWAFEIISIIGYLVKTIVYLIIWLIKIQG